MSEDLDLSRFFPIMKDERSGALLWKDLRSLTLQYVIPVSRLSKFLEGLSEGILYGAKCSACGAKYFPPRADCSRCGSSDIEWVEVSRKGKLLAYTVVNVKPESYQSYDDYVVGVMETENGFKVLAWIRCDDPKKLRRGIDVELEIPKREKNDLILYWIVPVDKV
ncbi:MAG: Zn-ribbon domain-containing OB-fold protein [Thaumarchaeota archaeon]|nr:Zn-ribbon domain-containing OB-fold protein [Nitrososphaerota archaeon]